MEFTKFSGKSIEAALEEAAAAFQVSSDDLEYEILDQGNVGFLGFGSKPAMIQARKKFTLTGSAEDFLKDVFRTMNMEVELETVYNEEEKTMDIDLKGDDMGILIGKRGQTLDSLQYLTSLVVNKYTEEYVRVKLDIENYRERRKETLETLARNIAYKVRRTRRPVSLEPMNPYERRIIHSSLQDDKYVVTRSEGEEPYRHIVISLKRERREYNNSRSGYRRDYSGRNRSYGGGGYGRSNYRSSSDRYSRYDYPSDRRERNTDGNDGETDTNE